MEGHRRGNLSLLQPILVNTARALLLSSHKLVVKCTSSGLKIHGRPLIIGFSLLLIIIAFGYEPICKLALMVCKVVKATCTTFDHTTLRCCLLLLREAIHDLCLDLLDEMLCP